ncbi:hypothetical protein GCM10008018_47490 [Paenibacillus marchantiophytorum]|uniref:YfhE family protein n=1 Tax=Paenibacillus marchantiophytorum TaxID=1619310 RepID=A0ABQ1F0W4_9BACL|nr:hypothetical protein GCM10008018_47490 [Paenibacillus marchantiophytorum]
MERNEEEFQRAAQNELNKDEDDNFRQEAGGCGEFFDKPIRAKSN